MWYDWGMQEMSTHISEVFRLSVRKEMDDRGITITALAKAVGTSRSGMSCILAGKDNVTLERAGRIAKAIGVPLSDLVDENIFEKAS